MSGHLVKRSVTLQRHRTSIALEPPFWQALTALAASRDQVLPQLIAEADGRRREEESLASVLRVLALKAAREGQIPSPKAKSRAARAAAQARG